MPVGKFFLNKLNITNLKRVNDSDKTNRLKFLALMSISKGFIH